MLHVDGIAKVEVESKAESHSQSFPKTRINKKKWLIGTLIVVGGGSSLCYQQKLKEEERPEPTSIGIQF